MELSFTLSKMTEEFLQQNKHDMRKLLDKIPSHFGIRFPLKYLFKISGIEYRIDALFDLYKDLDVSGIFNKIKYLVNDQGYTIDNREFFSIASYFHKDKEDVEINRLKNKIRKPKEDINKKLQEYDLKQKEYIVPIEKFSLEIDFLEALAKEIDDLLDKKKREEEFKKFISNYDVSNYDFLDPVEEKERRIITMEIPREDPLELFNRIRTSERYFLVKFRYDKTYTKLYSNDFTHNVILDASLEKEQEYNSLFIRFYPLEVSKKYMKKAVIDININLTTGQSDFIFTNYRGINKDKIIDTFKKTFDIFKIKYIEDVPDTVKYFIYGFRIERDVFLSMLYTKEFRQMVYIDESKKPSSTGKWVRFYIDVNDKKISFTVNNEVLNTATNIRKDSFYLSIPKDSEIVKITISKMESKKGKEMAEMLIYKCFDMYAQTYNDMKKKYSFLPKPIKPSKLDIKRTSLKEMIPNFKGGSISQQADYERMQLNIISEAEAKTLRKKGKQVMLYPPPNMKDIFDVNMKPFFIGPGDDEYPYIGLKINTSNKGDLSNEYFPYIPVYYKDKKLQIDEAYNVTITNINERNIDNRKNKLKDLSEGEQGNVYDDIIKIMGRDDIYRVGYGKDGLDAIIDDIFEVKIKVPSKIPPYCMQELYNFSSFPKNKEFETYHALLEKQCNVNIYLFEAIKNEVNMILPNHKDFYIPDPNLRNKCMVLFRNRKGEYELIKTSKKYLFDKEINIKLFNVLEFISQAKDIKIFNIMDIFPKIISQRLDIYGRILSVNVKDETLYTIFTPPLHPLDMEIDNTIYPLEKISDRFKNIKQDIRGMGISYEINDIKFRSYVKNIKLDYPIDNNLIFEDLSKSSIVKLKNSLIARMLKHLFGVFLLLSDDDNFMSSHTVIVKNHEYKEEYDSQTRIYKISDISLLKLPSYVMNGKLIMTNDIYDKFNILVPHLLKKYREKELFLTPAPYIFKKRYYHIADFDSHKNEMLFFDINIARLYVYERRNKPQKMIYTKLPDIITGEFIDAEKKNIIYPSKYNLPVEPLLFFDGKYYYWIQYLKDMERSSDQLDAANTIISIWDKYKINIGYYADSSTEYKKKYDEISIKSDGTISPDGKSCVLSYFPAITKKIKKSQMKYAAILKID